MLIANHLNYFVFDIAFQDLKAGLKDSLKVSNRLRFFFEITGPSREFETTHSEKKGAR